METVKTVMILKLFIGARTQMSVSSFQSHATESALMIPGLPILVEIAEANFIQLFICAIKSVSTFQSLAECVKKNLKNPQPLTAIGNVWKGILHATIHAQCLDIKNVLMLIYAYHLMSSVKHLVVK
jgi:hypothetical protein